MDSRVARVPTEISARLRVSLFGPVTIAHMGGSEIDISNRRGRALLAMLALTPSEPLERDQVSKLLWPGRFPAQARASLRQCLLSLSKEIAAAGAGAPLELTNQRIALANGGLSSDLAELKSALDAGDTTDACKLLGRIGARPVLEGIEFGAAFDDWLAIRRRAIENALHGAIETALVNLDRAGRVQDRGQLADAWRACGREQVAAAHTRLRIAILPFEQNDAVGAGEIFLAEGVVDELSARLASVSELALIGRTSIHAVADGSRTLPAIADALDATHLIEGSVNYFADSIRIALRLVEGSSGTEIWSDRWDGTLEDAMALRHAIGENVLNGLVKALGVRQSASPVRTMTANREAYALYLQGRGLTLRVVGDNIQAHGIRLLEQALEIDPEFSECWVALAEGHLYTTTFTPCLDRLERGEAMAECARRALEIDPANGHAMAMLGVYEFIKGNPVKALDLGYEAYRVAPENIDVNVRLGSFLIYLGRPREALPYIQFAIDRDPVHGRTYIALCAIYMSTGEHAKAIAAGERMATLGVPGLWLGLAHAAGGDHERATVVYNDVRFHLGTVISPPTGMERVDDTARDAYFGIASRGVCSGDPAARAAYCQLIDGLHRTMPDPYDPSIAYPAIWMGHFDLVRKIYTEQMHVANMFGLLTLWIDYEPVAKIRHHPEFLSFAEEVGFIAAWEKYGWPEMLPRPDDWAEPEQAAPIQS